MDFLLNPIFSFWLGIFSFGLDQKDEPDFKFGEFGRSAPKLCFVQLWLLWWRITQAMAILRYESFRIPRLGPVAILAQAATWLRLERTNVLPVCFVATGHLFLILLARTFRDVLSDSEAQQYDVAAVLKRIKETVSARVHGH